MVRARTGWCIGCLVVPTLLVTLAAPARAETCADVSAFNTAMANANAVTTKVTLTFDVTGVRPSDFANTKGCLAELLDARCAAGSTANLKVYGPYDPPNASHPAGTLKFEFGNQCCKAQPCQAEGWASPGTSATIFSSGAEKCAVKITLDPVHIAYHLDCGANGVFDAIGDNVDKVEVSKIAVLRRVDGGWPMPNASATNVKACWDPPAAKPGVEIADVPALEDATASSSSPGVYPGVVELAVESGDSEAFVKFDLGAVKGRVTKATLMLHESDLPSSNGDGGDAYAVSSAWSEGSLTWATRPIASGASLARVAPVSSYDWYAWDVSKAVDKPGVYSFAIRPEAGDTNGAHFFSKEGSKAFAPYLHVESVVVDADGDGVPDGLDCDDTSAAVHPGATEVCNGKDDDCDGVVDPGCAAKPDAGTSLGRPGVSFGDPDGQEAGGGCAIGARASANAPLAALVALALAAARRRRRR